MSLEAMKWAMDQTILTNPTDRHVLLVMANNAREDGTAAFPSIATIARRTGLSERTVKYSLRRMLEAGAIKRGSNAVVAAHIKRADQRPNNYDLTMGNGVQDIHPVDERGASDDSNGVHLTTERGAPAAPEPSFNPTNEPSIVGGQAAKRKKRRTQLPTDFYPNATGLQKAQAAGVSVAAELQAFVDHHTARGSVMADWQAAWRTWVRNAVRFAARDRGESYRERDRRQAAERMAAISPRIADWGAIKPDNVIDLGDIQNARAITG